MIQTEELGNKIDEMYKELASMKSCTKAGPSQTITDPETGEPKSVPGPDVPCYTESEIKAYANKISENEEIKKELDKDIEKLEGLAPLVESAQNIIQSAIDQVKGMYENPVTDAQGNQSFSANFNLDLSAYGINSDKDYKKIIEDYYNKINPKTDDSKPETNPQNSQENTGDYGTYSGGYTGGGGNRKGKKEEPSLTSVLGDAGEIVAIEEVEPELPTDLDTVVELISEPDTAAYEVVSTEITTEAAETYTEAYTIEKTDSSGTKGTRKLEPSTPSTPELPTEITVDVVEAANSADENLDNLVSDYLEEEVAVPIDKENIEQPAQPKVENNNSDRLATMGLASAIGVAIGSAAIGAHKILKDKDTEEDDEDK